MAILSIWAKVYLVLTLRTRYQYCGVGHWPLSGFSLYLHHSKLQHNQFGFPLCVEVPTNRRPARYRETLTIFRLPPFLMSTEGSRARAPRGTLCWIWAPLASSWPPFLLPSSCLFHQHFPCSLSCLLLPVTDTFFFPTALLPRPIWALALLLFGNRVISQTSWSTSEEQWRGEASPWRPVNLWSYLRALSRG